MITRHSPKGGIDERPAELEAGERGRLNAPAVRAAQHQDSFETALDMEKVGGELITMSNDKMKQLEYAEVCGTG